MRWMRHVGSLGAASLSLALGLGGPVEAQTFKNLQVLPKNIAKDQLKQIMKAQSKALGVECDHCHDMPDAASDANERKKVARQMMRMTAEVNDKWLKGKKDAEKNKVTCGTCHRGKAEPPAFVPPSK